MNRFFMVHLFIFEDTFFFKRAMPLQVKFEAFLIGSLGGHARQYKIFGMYF